MPRCNPASALLAVALAAALAAGCNGKPSNQALPTESPTEVPAASPTAVPPTATALPTSSPPPAPSQDEAARLASEGRHREAAVAYAAVAAATVSGAASHTQALIGQAAALSEGGQPEEAILTLWVAHRSSSVTTPEGMRATYLLGRRLNEAAAWTQAEPPLLQAAAQGSGPLMPYVTHEWARAAARSGRAPAAAAAWDGLLADPGTPSSLAVVVLRERADFAAEAGDTQAEAHWLAELVAAAAIPADRARLAAKASSLGDSATAIAQWQAIVAEAPGSRHSLTAIDALREAGLPVDPGVEGFSHYRRGAAAEAKRVLSVAVTEPGLGAAELTFRRFYLGAAEEDLGNYAAALANYDAAADLGAGTRYTHRARYWAARMAELLGNPVGASQRYVTLIQNPPSGEFTEESAFRAGYTLMAADQPEAAIATWNALGLPGSSHLLYWKARALLATGDSTLANEAFLEAAANDPLSFHGSESARALSGAGVAGFGYRTRDLSPPDWPSLESWLSARLGAPPPSPAPSVAGELAAVGLREEARALLESEASRAAGWELYRYLREAQSLGLADLALGLGIRLRSALGVAESQTPAALLKVIYPVSYVASFDEAARTYNVDPLLFAALIRQESLWNPRAASPAGALGLTQVIPPTGEAIAAALGESDFTPDDLLRPSLSLRFGASYFGGQLNRFGTPFAALAAYNAGPVAAARWSAATAGLPPADFVEAIDYAETRGYVQLVMEHYAHYLAAYAP